MEHVHTIDYPDFLETYTAHIQKNGEGWLGWIQEVPEVTSEEGTRAAVLKTLTTQLHEFLEADWEAWTQQFEEDVKAGRLDNVFEKALEDLHAGRCTDL